MPAGLGIQALQSIVAAGFYGEPRCCGAGTAERARTSIDPDVIKTSLQWRSKRHRRRHERLIPSDQEPAIADVVVFLASSGARYITGQKNNHIGDVLGLTEPAHGDDGSSSLRALRAQGMLLRQKVRCADVAGRYAIDADPLAREFDGETAHQAPDARLGRGAPHVLVPAVGPSH